MEQNKFVAYRIQTLERTVELIKSFAGCLDNPEQLIINLEAEIARLKPWLNEPWADVEVGVLFRKQTKEEYEAIRAEVLRTGIELPHELKLPYEPMLRCNGEKWQVRA